MAAAKKVERSKFITVPRTVNPQGKAVLSLISIINLENTPQNRQLVADMLAENLELMEKEKKSP